ncbi:MAG: BON domain-containing protein [Planctomycetaceae bacterium]|nr:BON domain-containing protein [Planctomycetaceae bacterium]
MRAIKKAPGRTGSRRRVDQPWLPPAVAARELLGRHPHFHARAEEFGVKLEGDALVVEGVVPSFYLKQLVQQVLRDVRGVRRVDNRVAVVNACGLSSHERR